METQKNPDQGLLLNGGKLAHSRRLSPVLQPLSPLEDEEISLMFVLGASFFLRPAQDLVAQHTCLLLDFLCSAAPSTLISGASGIIRIGGECSDVPPPSPPLFSNSALVLLAPRIRRTLEKAQWSGKIVLLETRSIRAMHKTLDRPD